MRMLKAASIILAILLPAALAGGCWNYREIDKLAMVAGVAVDKCTNGQYEITVEIPEMIGGRESKTKSKVLSGQGRSMFDAVRNIISVSGKKLYWAHTKVIILSKDIACDGVSNVLEWYNRDSETRQDVHVLISCGNTAKEVLVSHQDSEDILSFELDSILDNETSLSKAPTTDIMGFDIESHSIGVSPSVPAISLEQVDNKPTPKIMGTAIIKSDKLVGFLDGEETRNMLFARGEIKGGILFEQMHVVDRPTLVTLEIFGNRTDFSASMEDGRIVVDLNLETTVAIDEENGAGDFIDEDGMRRLQQAAQDTLEYQIDLLIRKMQTEYGADVFGFAASLWQNDPKMFQEVSGRWENTFRNMSVNVRSTVIIKNSAEFAEPVAGGG